MLQCTKIKMIFLFCFLLILSCKNNNKQELPPAQKSDKFVDNKKEKIKNILYNDSLFVNYDSSIWIDIQDLEPDIDLDIRYASTNNFVNEKMYECGKCFLRPEIAKALQKVQEDLREMGYGGLKIFDCYRPRPYQQALWDKVPDANYVSPPEKGSMHNRGAAVDLTIIDQYGMELDMGTDFDFFGVEAHHTYREFNDAILNNRKLLKDVMLKRGFKSIKTEWWHYSYYKAYEISDWIWECE